MKKIRQAFNLICGSLCTLFFVVSSWFTVAQASDVESQKRFETLEASIQTIMKNHNIPGIQGTIVTQDKVIWKGHFGVADVATQKAVSPSTLFRIGSVSKSITSLAILKAVEDGKISLEMNIEKELPEAEVSNFWKKDSPILLKHVLEHTAGFDDIHPRDFAFNDPDAKLIEGIHFNNGSRSARWQPGTRMSYSNMGPAIGALALEKASGEIFEDYVQREVFDELGMASATFHNDPEVSKSYGMDGTEAPYIHIGVRPSGAAAFTTNDMAAFVKMFLNRGAINDENFLSSNLITRMETSTSTNSAKKGMTTGYGLGNAVTQKEGYVFHGHTGGIDGFLSSFDYLPEHNIGYFFSMNMSNEKAFIELSAVLQKFVTQDMPKGEVPSPVSLTQEEINSISGIYKPVSPRWQFMKGIELFFNMKTIKVTGGEIFISNLLNNAEPQEWVSVGGHQYRQVDDVLPSMTFYEIEDGKQYIQSMRGTFEKVSFFSVLVRWISVVLVVVLFLTSWGYAIFWGVQMVRRRFDYERGALVRILPFLTTIMIPFCIFSFAVSMGDMTTVHLPKISSISFWLGTWVFAIMSVFSTAYICRRWKDRSKIGLLPWSHSLMVASAMMITAIYFTYHGLIGIRLWAY